MDATTVATIIGVGTLVFNGILAALYFEPRRDSHSAQAWKDRRQALLNEFELLKREAEQRERTG